ncbi:MAG TPA: hypothetical protein VK858_14545 [Longimicrobiales bacterium]|nr:hypothetical protein [Longimicrobiales bacterium]
MSSRRCLRFALPVLVGLAACDDDDPTVPFVPLSEAEAELVGVGLWRQSHGVSLEIPLGFDFAVGSPVARAPVSIDRKDEGSPACPLAGSVRYEVTVTGTVDDETGAGSLTIVTEQVHESCTLQEEQLVFTLDGNPGVTTEVDFSTDGVGNFETSGTMTGEVDAMVGETVGRCPVDLAFEGGETSTGAASYQIAGTMCGVEVSASFTRGG